jgi:hypothetical protein
MVAAEVENEESPDTMMSIMRMNGMKENIVDYEMKLHTSFVKQSSPFDMGVYISYLETNESYLFIELWSFLL